MAKITQAEKTQRLLARKSKHIQDLQSIGFIGDFYKLQLLEKKGRRIALNYCNAVIDTDEMQKRFNILEKEIALHFTGNKLPEGVFLNSDPRGSCIKLDSDFNAFNQETYRNLVNQRDFGGNGLIAPSDEILMDL